jgi:hypothetical protein
MLCVAWSPVVSDALSNVVVEEEHAEGFEGKRPVVWGKQGSLLMGRLCKVGRWSLNEPFS